MTSATSRPSSSRMFVAAVYSGPSTPVRPWIGWGRGRRAAPCSAIPASQATPAMPAIAGATMRRVHPSAVAKVVGALARAVGRTAR